MRPAGRFAVAALLAIVVAHLGDRWAYHHLVNPQVYEKDLGRMLRVVGFLPLWLVGGIAVGLQERSARRGWAVAFTPALAGGVDELLKMLLRRERPNLHDGAYVFRPFTDRPFNTADIGLPSSHAIVAFAGAWVLSRLYPRATPVWLAMAAGCALTRVLAQAHFLSDVTVAAVAGIAVAEGVVRRFRVVSEG